MKIVILNISKEKHYLKKCFFITHAWKKKPFIWWNKNYKIKKNNFEWWGL